MKKIPVNVEIPEGHELIDNSPAVAVVGDKLMIMFSVRPIAQGIGQAVDVTENVEIPAGYWLCNGSNYNDMVLQQAKADKAAYPEVWWKAWMYRTKNTNAQWITPIHGSNFGVSNDGCEYRRHPLADIIMQVESDKINHAGYWWQLWEIKSLISKEYCKFSMPFNVESDFEYRQHPHRKNIIAYHACSDADKKRWQYRLKGKSSAESNGWQDCENDRMYPNWSESMEYRLRPKICTVTMGDKVYEYPEPVREPLKVG